MMESYFRLKAGRERFQPWKNDGISALPLLLQKYDDRELFYIGLESKSLWSTVETIVKRDFELPEFLINQLPPIDQSTSGRLFARLPSETKLELVYHVNIRDMTALCQSCKFFWREGTKVMERFMKRCFDTMGLDWGSIRFAIRHMRSILSGAVVRQLAFLESQPFNIDEFQFLEVRTMHTEYVVKYFETATEYKTDEQYVSPSNVTVLHRPHHPSAFRIMIYETHESPQCSVFYQKSTASFLWLDADGFVAPYASLTFDRKTLIAYPINDKSLEAEIQRARAHNIKIIPFHGEGGDCGTAATCPSIVRNTLDTSCFNERFLSPVWSYRRVARNEKTEVVWCLGSAGCRDGLRGRFFVKEFFSLSDNQGDIGV
ncbi:hypothetical protein R3P38DRAFT_3211591 [Favolaschia claudopus]|uniref:F-box domain-containing protein n=1 Tax=Favolaschia claudopus TaxID=2862362 RepID=A0AAW0AFP0_9AGAR